MTCKITVGCCNDVYWNEQHIYKAEDVKAMEKEETDEEDVGQEEDDGKEWELTGITPLRNFKEKITLHIGAGGRHRTRHWFVDFQENSKISLIEGTPSLITNFSYPIPVFIINSRGISEGDSVEIEKYIFNYYGYDMCVYGLISGEDTFDLNLVKLNEECTITKIIVSIPVVLEVTNTSSGVVYQVGTLNEDEEVITTEEEEKEMSKIEKAKKIGVEVVNRNKTAAVEAAKLELGNVALNQALKQISKQVPFYVKPYLKHPAAKIVLANIVSVAVTQFRPDNEKLNAVSDAMLTAAFQEQIQSFNLDKIIDEFLNGIDGKLLDSVVKGGGDDK